jgi:hypothetical protein
MSNIAYRPVAGTPIVAVSTRATLGYGPRMAPHLASHFASYAEYLEEKAKEM